METKPPILSYASPPPPRNWTQRLQWLANLLGWIVSVPMILFGMLLLVGSISAFEYWRANPTTRDFHRNVEETIRLAACSVVFFSGAVFILIRIARVRRRAADCPADQNDEVAMLDVRLNDFRSTP